MSSSYVPDVSLEWSEKNFFSQIGKSVALKTEKV